MGWEPYFRLRFAYAILLALLMLELAIGFAIASYLGAGMVYQFNRMVAGLLLLAWLAYVPLWAVITRKPEPTRWTLETYRANIPWFAIASMLLLLAWFKTLHLAALKNAIPSIMPFYADPMLADLDRMIFFTDPWRITHALVGEFGTRVIDVVYALWHPVQLGFGCWLILSRKPLVQLRGLISFTLCWLILGGVFAVLFSSVGPCFYDDYYGSDRFAPLMDGLAAPLSLSSMDFLLESVGTSAVASGISAFPSMHVSVAVWEALLLQLAFRNRYVIAAGWLWAFAIFFASVHLGWHYAVDGIFAAVGTVLFWKLAQWIVAYDPRSSRSRAAAETGSVLQG